MVRREKNWRWERRDEIPIATPLLSVIKADKENETGACARQDKTKQMWKYSTVLYTTRALDSTTFREMIRLNIPSY